jgi:hypothetical protein
MTIATSLQIVDHGVVVRTVRMHTSMRLTADDLGDWARPGYCEVDLNGKDMNADQTLCKPRLCNVIEPGHGSGGRFNNLVKATTTVGPNKRKILLSGTVTISGSAAIAWVDAQTSWDPTPCTKTSQSCSEISQYAGARPARPVAVTPGQQVRITTTVTMPRHA